MLFLDKKSPFLLSKMWGFDKMKALKHSARQPLEKPMPIKESYLGDGLYVSHDGYHVVLRAPRDGGDHWVGLEPQVLAQFMRWVLINKLIEPEGGK